MCQEMATSNSTLLRGELSSKITIAFVICRLCASLTNSRLCVCLLFTTTLTGLFYLRFAPTYATELAAMIKWVNIAAKCLKGQPLATA